VAPDDAVFDFLIWLARHEASVRETYGNCAEMTVALVRDPPNWTPVTEEELKFTFEHHPTIGETHAMNGWLYLPQLPRGVGRIPLLNCRYDRSSGRMSLSVQLAVFWVDDACTIYADAWRFESPGQHGASSLGDHAYYHAQPCRLLRTHRSGEVLLKHEPAASSADVPTFPLDAQDALSLLVAMLVTIYGRRDAFLLIRESAIPELETALADMRTLDPRHDPTVS
jgi:hypothetical protein